MMGIRNNCELVHAYIGGNAGLFTGFLLLFGITAAAGSAESVQLAFMTSVFSIMFVTFQFTVLYGVKFWRFLISIILIGLIYGFVMYYLMLLISIRLMQPFLMALVGVLLGIVLSRILCANCFGKQKLTQALKKE